MIGNGLRSAQSCAAPARLSRAFLTAGKDLVSGAGLGIGVVGIIVIIVGWRENRQ
jgi:hypothetical protein